MRRVACLVLACAVVAPLARRSGRPCSTIRRSCSTARRSSTAPAPRRSRTARIVIAGRAHRGDRAAGRARRRRRAPSASTSAGETIVPGLIDLHFHIESDPRLALRQLSHGVTAFRDPGQWNEKFVELRQMIAADGLAGPRIFTCRPAHRRRAPRLSRRRGRRARCRRGAAPGRANIEQGATALKIYFRLPLGERQGGDRRLQRAPHAVHGASRDPRRARGAAAPGCTASSTSPRSAPSLLPPRAARDNTGRPCSLDNDARRDGRYAMFAHIDLDGPDAQGALRRAARRGVRGSIRRSPCSSAARTRRRRRRRARRRR